MPIARYVLAALLSSAPIQGQPLPDPHHIVGDLCARAEEASPSTHIYHLRNGSTVVFVAVAHAVDARSVVHKKAVLDQVATAFDRYKPDFVLVEGASARKSDDAAYRVSAYGLSYRRHMIETDNKSLS